MSGDQGPRRPQTMEYSMATMALVAGLAMSGAPMGRRLKQARLRRKAKTPAQIARKAKQVAQRKARKITRQNP